MLHFLHELLNSFHEPSRSPETRGDLLPGTFFHEGVRQPVPMAGRKIEEVKRDIAQGVNYVVLDGDSLIATFSAIPGIDPTYLDIEGEWLNDEEYVTIHKLAKGKGGTHIFEFVVDFCFRIADNIRIDTHEDNAPMRHLLKKNGFSYCGIIHLKNGEPRLAFQKIRKKDD